MKQKPVTIMPPKPRALLLYDADREIDVAHPLWNELMLYGQSFEELHVFVFIRHLAPGKMRVVNLSPNVFAYYLPGNIFWRLDDAWPMIKYHLVWNGLFRPHLVLNFSTHSGAVLGLLLAKRYKRRFFVSTTGSFLDMPMLSRDFLLHYLVMKGADRIFVPGEKLAGALASRIGARKVSVVRPAIDMSFLERKIHPMQYQAVHPGHTVFLVTEASIGHKREFAFLFKVFAAILNRHPRAALIILVPSAQVAAAKRLARRVRSVYICAATDDRIAYIAGATIYLSISESEESGIPVIEALGLHVPVVTVATGVVGELFAGSHYEAYMKPFGDVGGFTAALMSLIGDQQQRDEYRLNSTILLRSLTVQNLQGHVAAIMHDIVAEV